MLILPSARKHGIRDEDMLHAIENPLRVLEQEYQGSDQLVYLGPDTAGNMLEVVVMADEPVRVRHADRMRKKFERFL